MNVEEALSRYTLQLKADGRSDHTVLQYARHVRMFGRWLAAEGRRDELEGIDHEVVALFLVSDVATLAPDGRRKRATSMNALRSSLRTFFGYLHAAGWTRSNPARLVRRARCGSPPPRALSDAERERLLAALDGAIGREGERDRVLFRLMLETGIRVGSALGLNVEDVDLEAGELWLQSTKGDRPDKVFLPPRTAEMLRGFVTGRSGPVFVGRGGRRLGARNVQRRFAKCCLEANIGRAASPHSLRHTFATGLYRRSGDVFLVKEALRHRSVASTLVYARCGEERLRLGIDGALVTAPVL